MLVPGDEPTEARAPTGPAPPVPLAEAPRAVLAGGAAEVEPEGRGEDRDEHRREVLLPDVASGPVPAAAQTLRELEVAGTVVVLDAEGGLEPPAEGSLGLTLWTGSSGRTVTIPVVSGRWRLTLVEDGEGFVTTGEPPAESWPAEIERAWITVSSRELAMGGGSLKLLAEARFSFGQQDVEVRLQRVRDLQLRVEDERTRAPLSGISVLRIGDGLKDHLEHPGLGQDMLPLFEDATSPLAYRTDQAEVRRGSQTWLVGCPRYAWKAVELDLSAGGERLVLLEPGATLEVELQGDTSMPGLELRLRKGVPSGGGSRPCLEASLATAPAQPLLFEGLPAAELVASVEVGPWFRQPEVLARTPVTLAPGRVTRCRLVLEAPPVLVTAPLSGRLYVPAAWELARPLLTLRLLDTPLDGTNGWRIVMPPDLRRTSHPDEDPVVFGFDLGEVQVGRYDIELYGPSYGEVFDVGPGGRSDVELRVPPPADVTVLVRDTTTGRPAEIERLHWQCERPEGGRGGGLGTLDPGEDRFHLRLPRTRVKVQTPMGSDYGRASAQFVPEDGLEVVLEVRPTSVALLQLVDEGHPVRWPHKELTRVEAADGSPARVTRGSRDGRFCIADGPPGRYRIFPPAIEGYRPLPPIEVELVEGRTSEVTVPLERLP